MSVTLNTEKTVAVDRDYFMRPIDSETPLGVSLLLGNKAAGVTRHGVLKDGDTFWTHWSPFPKFPEK